MAVDEAGVEAVAGADRVDRVAAQGGGPHDHGAVERQRALGAALHDGPRPQGGEVDEHALEAGSPAGSPTGSSPRLAATASASSRFGKGRDRSRAASRAGRPASGPPSRPAVSSEVVAPSRRASAKRSGELGRELGQQVERAHVQVPGRAVASASRTIAAVSSPTQPSEVSIARSRSAPGRTRCTVSPVARPGQHDAARDVDAAGRELVEHEAARGVVADHADEGDAQTEPRRAAGHDGRRAADRQGAALDQRLGLAEGDLAGDVADDDVGHGVAGDEQVERCSAGGRALGRLAVASTCRSRASLMRSEPHPRRRRESLVDRRAAVGIEEVQRPRVEPELHLVRPRAPRCRPRAGRRRCLRVARPRPPRRCRPTRSPRSPPRGPVSGRRCPRARRPRGRGSREARPSASITLSVSALSTSAASSTFCGRTPSTTRRPT